jgi:peptide deformylase
MNILNPVSDEINDADAYDLDGADDSEEEVPRPNCCPVTLYGNPVLRQRAIPVTLFDESLDILVSELFDTMYSIGSGVGLAANQIGRPESVFVFDCRDGVAGHVVNPTLEIIGEELQDDWEGCLSLPGVDLSTVRYEGCRVTGVDVRGAPVSYEGEEFRSRCFQHETDHLRGVLYMDHHPVRVRKKLEAEMSKMDWWGSLAIDPRSETYREAQSPAG